MLTVVGAGAVGTTLATYLSAAGKPVRLYARGKDQEPFRQAGRLRLERPRGGVLEAPLPPLTEHLVDTDTRYLLICTKFSALDAVLDAIGAAPPGLCLISTLNGVRALPRLRQQRPELRSLPMSIMFNAQHLGVLSAQLTTKPAVIVADGDAALHGLLAGTGLRVNRSRGERACWGKLLINLANAIGALTQSTFRDLLSDPDLRVIFAAVLEEAVDRIESAGIDYRLPMPLPYRGYRLLLRHGGPLGWWLARLRNGLDDGAYPSMVSDVRAGRGTEVRQLNGEIVALGEKLHWPAPINGRLVELVEQLDRSQPQRLGAAELRRLLGL
ncbi:MAG: ketopantoate reductase C-terminal domain-containing protein [Stagnimonas sp.]|nr:ketopantoate reductase C-terminal domain-containing protein [Stagnimonas sp.]